VPNMLHPSWEARASSVLVAGLAAFLIEGEPRSFQPGVLALLLRTFASHCRCVFGLGPTYRVGEIRSSFGLVGCRAFVLYDRHYQKEYA
jgi:hypothetical protein